MQRSQHRTVVVDLSQEAVWSLDDRRPLVVTTLDNHPNNLEIDCYTPGAKGKEIQNVPNGRGFRAARTTVAGQFCEYTEAEGCRTNSWTINYLRVWRWRRRRQRRSFPNSAVRSAGVTESRQQPKSDPVNWHASKHTCKVWIATKNAGNPRGSTSCFNLVIVFVSFKDLFVPTSVQVMHTTRSYTINCVMPCLP